MVCQLRCLHFAVLLASLVDHQHQQQSLCPAALEHVLVVAFCQEAALTMTWARLGLWAANARVGALVDNILARVGGDLGWGDLGLECRFKQKICRRMFTSACLFRQLCSCGGLASEGAATVRLSTSFLQIDDPS